MTETDDCAAGGVGLARPNLRRGKLVDLLLQGVKLRVGLLVGVVAVEAFKEFVVLVAEALQPCGRLSKSTCASDKRARISKARCNRRRA